jgi:hypothetical protein
MMQNPDSANWSRMGGVLEADCQNDFATEFATVGKLRCRRKSNRQWKLRPKKN